MMELRCLSKPEYRVVLWRNTIQLFHKYNRPAFIGPFKAAGFNRYIVERFFLDDKGNSCKPDIVSSGDSGWMVLELTANKDSKEQKLGSYQKIDSRYLGTYGLLTPKNNPDIISVRLDFMEDGKYCQILVKNVFDLKDENLLNNETLKSELIKAKNMQLDLTKLPEIPIALVPEMIGKSFEIRRGLSEIIMQIFEPGGSKTPLQIVDDGLERLADKISPEEKGRLIDSVKTHTDLLIKEHLSEYIEFKDGAYKVRDGVNQHPKIRETVVSKLKEWANPKQSKLNEYIPA